MPNVKSVLVRASVIAALAIAAVPFVQSQVRATPQSDQAPVDAKITTPKQEWGHNIGDDYFLANYQQLLAYWKKLDAQSDRDAGRRDGPDVDEEAADDGDHHRAGQLREARSATKTSRGGCRWPKG